MPGKAFAWPFQVFFLQTIKSIQHCMGIECYKILRFPKTEMWKKKTHVFFQNVVYQRVSSPCFGIFYPLPHPTHQVVTTRSSMTLVAGMPLWLGVILHEGTTFLVARILSISVVVSGRFFGMFTSKIGENFGIFTSKIGEINKWTKLTHILQIGWNHQLVRNFHNDDWWVSNFSWYDVEGSYRNPMAKNLGWCSNPVKHGINYQPQLVSRISEPSTVGCVHFEPAVLLFLLVFVHRF